MDLYDVSSTFVLPRHADDATSVPRGSPYVAAAGGLIVAAPAAYFTRVILGVEPILIGAAMAAVFGLVIGGWAIARVIARRRRRGAFRRALARRDAVDAHEIDALPTETPEPIRIRGRVRIAMEDDGPMLRVVDEAGLGVRVRVAPTTRAWDESGECDILREGDDVEIVGRGHRHRGAGDGYRDTEGEFVFADEGPVEFFVRARGA